MPVIPVFERWRQGDQEFKKNLRVVTVLSPGCATQDPLSTNKQTNRKKNSQKEKNINEFFFFNDYYV